jgi:hypothetical protein
MTYPPQGGYPDQQGGYPDPQYPGYNPAQPGYPPAQPGYPTSAPPGYPAQPGYPPPQPGYPTSAPPGYPAQPGYPPAGPGYPEQPGYPQNPMGYPQPGYAGDWQQAGYAQAPPVPRPTTVTVASMLMIALPIISVIGYVAGLAATSTLRDNLRHAYEQAGLSTDVINNSTTSLTGSFSGIISLIIAVAIGVLAVFNLRGANGARITTWVLLGIMLLLSVCGLVALGASQAALRTLTANTSGANLDFSHIFPSWYLPLSYLLAGLNIIIYIAVITLLAMPASHPFFRRQPA